MNKLEQMLDKKYRDKLVKLSLYKKKLGKMQEFLKEYRIACSPKDDVSYFQCEVLYESLYNKKRLEDSFMDSFVEMQDFWYDLDYKERNHLVNVDIERRCGDLKYFLFHDQKIYIPVFDEKLNHLYADEIVNLELKQYRTFTKEFGSEMAYGIYGSLPYQHHFSSAQWIADDAQGYCLYFSKLNRFYYIVNEKCEKVLSLDPERRDQLGLEEKQQVAAAFMDGQEQMVAELLLQYSCIDERMQKKVQKLLRKMNS